jgi:hypothetical protein
MNLHKPSMYERNYLLFSVTVQVETYDELLNSQSTK